MSVCRTRDSHRSPLTALPDSRNTSPGAPENQLTTRSVPIRILRLTQVIEATGLGKTKIYELQAAGDFSMRVQITAHSVGWVEEEVQAWLSRRIASRPTLPGSSVAEPPLR